MTAKQLAKKQYMREWRKRNRDRLRDALRMWQRANPDKVLASSRKWRSKNKDVKRRADRAWAAANKDKVGAANRRWKAAHPDAARASAIAAALKWQAKNPEKAKAIAKRSGAAWAKANPDKVRASAKKWEAGHRAECLERSARRRARKLAQTPPLTPDEQSDIIALYAKARALTELIGEPYHVDHIKPLSKGGLHHPSNLQVLRGVDNLKKGAKYD